MFSTELPELPVEIQNGRVVVNYKPRQNSSVVGTNITYECEEDFVLSTETSQFVGNADGTWNSDDLNPRCLRGNKKLKLVLQLE